MRGKTLRDLKYLKQNYKPSEIQKLLNSSKLKREVYQELKVSEYVLNNYIKHYKLSNIHKNGQRSLNKNSIGNENPKKVSIDNSIFREIENPVRRFQENEKDKNIKGIKRSLLLTTEIYCKKVYNCR
jgi:hypothetical protein